MDESCCVNASKIAWARVKSNSMPWTSSCGEKTSFSMDRRPAKIPIPRRECRRLGEHLGKTKHAVHRGANLVTHHREELALGLLPRRGLQAEGPFVLQILPKHLLALELLGDIPVRADHSQRLTGSVAKKEPLGTNVAGDATRRHEDAKGRVKRPCGRPEPC
ncbi:hypothetical protein BH09VER1_BH09VER1_46980 [soil metagenome]